MLALATSSRIRDLTPAIRRERERERESPGIGARVNKHSDGIPIRRATAAATERRDISGNVAYTMASSTVIVANSEDRSRRGQLPAVPISWDNPI